MNESRIALIILLSSVFLSAFSLGYVFFAYSYASLKNPETESYSSMPDFSKYQVNEGEYIECLDILNIECSGRTIKARIKNSGKKKTEREWTLDVMVDSIQQGSALVSKALNIGEEHEFEFLIKKEMEKNQSYDIRIKTDAMSGKVNCTVL